MALALLERKRMHPSAALLVAAVGATAEKLDCRFQDEVEEGSLKGCGCSGILQVGSNKDDEGRMDVSHRCIAPVSEAAVWDDAVSRGGFICLYACWLLAGDVFLQLYIKGSHYVQSWCDHNTIGSRSDPRRPGNARRRIRSSLD